MKKENEDNKELLSFMKEAIPGEVEDIRFTNRLSKHPVCLTTEGALSIEMQKAYTADNNSIKESILNEDNIEVDYETGEVIEEVEYTDPSQEVKDSEEQNNFEETPFEE